VRALVLQPVVKGAAPGAEDEPPSGEAAKKTANSARLSRLQQLVEEALRTANTFDPSETRDDHGKWSAAEVESLKDFFYKLKSEPNAHLQAPIGELGGRAAQRIRKVLGQDVTELWVHADEFRHVKRNHPEIGEADWHALPETIRTADDVRASTTQGGEPAVEVWKKEENWKFVVGTGRDGTNRLYVRTFKHRREKP
jgi:hypothetical protein